MHTKKTAQIQKFTAVFALIIGLIFAPSAHSQPSITEQLDKSPRHQEWVQINSNGRTLHNFVVYPEISENALAVIVIHENKGLTDWVRLFADQLAGAGYLVIAPDLLSGFSAQYKRTADFPTGDDAKAAIYELDASKVTADLEAVQTYVKNLPAANGKTAVIGFCWGGAQSFRFAVNNTQIKAALVFYGSPPEHEDYKKIQAPVYGFYGGEDQRINATIPATEKKMQKLGKTYDYEIYPGATHAFMRKADEPGVSDADKAAGAAAWERIRKILAGL